MMIQETIHYRKRVPVEFHLVEVTKYPIHYHSAFELVLVLNGSVTIKDGYDKTEVRKGDLWFIDSGDLHSFTKTDEDNLLLLLHFDFYYFEKYFPGLQKLFFPSIIKSNDEAAQQAVRKLKRQVAEIAYCLAAKNRFDRDQTENIAIELIQNLINNFQYFEMQDGKFINKPQQKENIIMGKRIKRIFGYIYNEYNQNLSLNDIAAREHLNSNYLSHIIKETTQMGFQELLNLVRVENSEKLLAPGFFMGGQGTAN